MKWNSSILVLVLASFFAVSFAADLKNERVNAGGVPIPPTNKEVEAVIDKAEDLLEKAKDAGRDSTPPLAQQNKEKIVEDLQDLLETAKDLLEKKNKGDLLQKFIVHSSQAFKRVVEDKIPEAKDVISDEFSRISGQMETELVKRKTARIGQLARSLIFQVMKSGEFRTLLSDISNWIKEGLLTPVVEAGKDTADTLLDKGKNLAETVLGEGASAADSAKKGLESIHGYKDIDSKTVGDATEEIYEKGKNIAKEAVKVGKDAAGTLYEQGLGVVNEVKSKMTDEQQFQHITNRFRELVDRISRDPNLREGMKDLSELIDILKQEGIKAKELLKESAERTKETVSNVGSAEQQLIDQALHEGRVLLDQLLGVGPSPGLPKGQIGGRSTRTPIDDLVDGWRELMTFIQQDEKLNSFLSRAREFWTKSVNDPELLLGITEEQIEEKTGIPAEKFHPRKITKKPPPHKYSPQEVARHRELGDNLLRDGKKVFTDVRYSRPAMKLLHAWDTIDNLVRNDPVGNRFASSLRRLMKDLSWDPLRGSVAFNLETLVHMKGWLIPVISEVIKNVSLPVIAGSTDKYDFAFEGLRLTDVVILPDHVHIHTNEDLSLNVNDISLEQIKANISLHLSNIQTSIHDAKFWFKRKTFPRIEDEGVIDLELTGDGAEIIIDMEALYHTDKPTEFTVKNIQCHIDKLVLNIKDANHRWLYSFAKSLFSGTIKRNFEKSIEEVLWSAVNEFSTQWSKWSNIASEALDMTASKTEGVRVVVDSVINKAKEMATGR